MHAGRSGQGTMAEQLARFVENASYAGLSEAARRQLKLRILDSLGCAIGALEGEPMRVLRRHQDELGGPGPCTLIGGGRTAPDRAAFYNAALVRYLDFNDAYLAKGETCHPSDNLSAVLAACEHAKADGVRLLTALAVAYQVQCRLSDVAPVRAEGFDHTTQGAFAVAAGVSKALGLDVHRTANAIAICGTAFHALRVARTGVLSHWKGLAYPNLAFGCMHAALLAMRGITGPPEIFEGNKGLMDTMTGPFTIAWASEDLELVNLTIVKQFNAEIHSQSAIEGILRLRAAHPISVEDIVRVEIEIFQAAYDIIGGGEEGDKTIVQSKEEADHSLPYIIAAALLDGRVMPEQYDPERIRRADVQALLRKVIVRPNGEYSREFPERMPCRVTVVLNDARRLTIEQRDYEGFHTNPAIWAGAVKKFERLSAPYADAALRRDIIDTVDRLDIVRVDALARLLARVRTSKPPATSAAVGEGRR